MSHPDIALTWDRSGYAVISRPGIYCNTGCRTGNIRVVNLVCFG